MQLNIRRSMWLMFVCGSIVTLSASPPVIGVARSRGAFMINNASVPGTATILDGTSVKTLGLSSDVKLKTGERLTLGSGSAATIYQDRLVLQSGVAEVDRLAAYRVEAGDLRIGASTSNTSVRVALSGSRQVQIVAMAGTAEVRNAKGVLLARILSGTALQLNTTQTQNNTAIQLTGEVTSEEGKFFLTDETTKVKYELRGPSVKDLVGKKVHVTGSTIAAEAADDVAVVTVASATVLTAAGAIAPVGAAVGAAAGAAIGMTTIVVVSAVAVGGTLGGLAVAGTFSASEPTVSR